MPPVPLTRGAALTSRGGGQACGQCFARWENGRVYEEAVMDMGSALWRSSGSPASVIAADGCVDLILRDDDVWVAGPSTTWIHTRSDGSAGSLGLRFLPGDSAELLRINLAEVTDQVVLAEDLLDGAVARRMRTTLRRVRESWSESGPIAGLSAAADRPSNPWAASVREHSVRGTAASEVAISLGWSDRTFRRGMLERFGYPYSTLARIQRVRRAQALLTSGRTLGDAAVQAGYSDQPHLTREFKRLVGATPSQFLASSA